MSKIVKIQTGIATEPMGPFGNKVVKFVYDDGLDAVAGHGAFVGGDEEIIDVVKNGNAFVLGVLEMAKADKNAGERRHAETVTQWDTIYTA